MSKLSVVITKVSITQIPENALIDGVVKQLRGREMFTDADPDLGERIYSGDVFEAILGELGEMEDSPLYPNEKTITQLEELAKLINTEYVQVTMT
jgi:hypothetical protein